MKSCSIAVVAFALFVSAPLAQYRWVDPSGQVNYGDVPPGDARDLRRLDGRTAATNDAATAVPYELRRAIAQFPITLYSSDECRPCDSGRALLSKRGVPFSERLVDSVEATAELKKLTGIDKVPVLSVGRDVLAGYDALKWERALDAAGYPAQVVTPATNSPAQSLVARSPTSPANKSAGSP